MLHLFPPKNRVAAWDLKWAAYLLVSSLSRLFTKSWWQLSLPSSMFQGVWPHWTAQKNCWSCLGPFWRCKHESIVIVHWFDCIAMILLVHNGGRQTIAIRYSFPMQTDQPTQPILLGFHFWMVRFSNDMMETKKPKSYMTGGPWLLRGEPCLQQNGETPRS